MSKTDELVDMIYRHKTADWATRQKLTEDFDSLFHSREVKEELAKADGTLFFVEVQGFDDGRPAIVQADTAQQAYLKVLLERGIGDRPARMILPMHDHGAGHYGTITLRFQSLTEPGNATF